MKLGEKDRVKEAKGTKEGTVSCAKYYEEIKQGRD